MTEKRKIPQRIVKLINESLEAIIDQWYLSVSDYYVTVERKAENPDIQFPEELKRFHDDSGHRIKFNKGDLDFTYGLSIESGPRGCLQGAFHRHADEEALLSVPINAQLTLLRVHG